LAQLEKDIQDRTHDLDMRALELRQRAESGQEQRAVVSQRSVGTNTPPSAPQISAKSNTHDGVAFNMLMRMIKRGNHLIMHHAV
jgi:hypothetical protein